MEKVRIVSIAVAIVILVALAAIIISMQVPASYKPVDGPSNDNIRTNGVFKPGGYVNFVFKPGIESIAGKHKGYVYTSAYTPGIYYKANDLLWKMHQYSFGQDWSDTIAGGSTTTFSIRHKVFIPNDPSLAGRPVLFELLYTVNYPYIMGGDVFRNTNKSYTHLIEITLGNTLLSEDEADYIENPRYYLVLIAFLLIAGFIFALRYAIKPSLWKRRSRQ